METCKEPVVRHVCVRQPTASAVGRSVTCQKRKPTDGSQSPSTVCLQHTQALNNCKCVRSGGSRFLVGTRRIWECTYVRQCCYPVAASTDQTVLKYLHTVLQSRRVDTVPTCPGAVHQQLPKRHSNLTKSVKHRTCAQVRMMLLWQPAFFCVVLWKAGFYSLLGFRFHTALLFELPYWYKLCHCVSKKKKKKQFAIKMPLL